MYSVSFILVCLISKNSQLVESQISKAIGPFVSYKEAEIFERGGMEPISNEQGECKIVKSSISGYKQMKTLAKN